MLTTFKDRAFSARAFLEVAPLLVENHDKIEEITKKVIGSILAIVPISAFSAVISTGKVADSSNLSHYDKTIGLSLESIKPSFTGRVLLAGEITNNTWNWNTGDIIFLNRTSLSTTPPNSGWSQRIATAKDRTTLVVELAKPILL